MTFRSATTAGSRRPFGPSTAVALRRALADDLRERVAIVWLVRRMDRLTAEMQRLAGTGASSDELAQLDRRLARLREDVRRLRAAWAARPAEGARTGASRSRLLPRG